MGEAGDGCGDEIVELCKQARAAGWLDDGFGVLDICFRSSGATTFGLRFRPGWGESVEKNGRNIVEWEKGRS